MKTFLFAILLILVPVLTYGSENQAPKFLWYRDVPKEDKDYYVAFRGQLDVASEGGYDIQLLGASWFAGWLDGKYFCEGPARFPAAYPEFQTFRMQFTKGHHTLALQVHQVGEVTRLLDNFEPFLYCVMEKNGNEIPVSWKCMRLEGYESQVKRINPELGFIEWCDTRKLPEGWKENYFDDLKWNAPVAVARNLGSLAPLFSANTTSTIHTVKPVTSGQFVDKFGYEKDDPAVRFFLCDLAPQKTPPQGVWRLYDFGYIRLIRPRFILDLPEGSVVEFACCEELINGRVNPWITLSAGESCNMDHYTARGGPQEFFPLTPKGGRFLEIHIYAPPDKVQFINEEILERSYFGNPLGSFQTSDTLLNKIWSVGVETLHSCSEDAIIDNPTRERGQWTGDVVTVGMDITAVAFSDMRLLKRALLQSAECARTDGMVAGLSPGGPGYLSTFAALWVNACIHYWELTGDLKLLNDLFPYAEKNIQAFEMQNTSQGLKDNLGWGFVDWGYIRNTGPSDMAVNLYYLAALHDMIRWSEAIGKKDIGSHYQILVQSMSSIIKEYFLAEFQNGAEPWTRIGYHRAVLGLKLGFFEGTKEKQCVEFIKNHMLRCFPNDSTAPRLSNPEVRDFRLITPYFGQYAMPVLIEHGEINFVLGQFRKCWGWMLEDNRSTWLEVFDTRWSHCHQWSGCPTWQMSQFLLGLQARYDLGNRHFIFVLNPGSLKNAHGTIPISGDSGVLNVNWSYESDGLRYHLETPVPIYLHLDEKQTGQISKVVYVEKEFEMVFNNY